MKQDELLKYSRCSLCGLKIGHTGLPLFWRVTVERFGIDMSAVRRQDGLAALLGDRVGWIAGVMGPQEDMTQRMMDKVTLSICESCAMAQTMVAHLGELKDVLAEPVKKNADQA